MKLKNKSEKKGSTHENEDIDQQSKNNLDFKTLTVHGSMFRTLLTKKYENRKKWEKRNPNHIVSFIPGTIMNVLVKDGQKVDKDQPILIFEAMKMENTIFAPHTGKIKKVHVKNSDKVSKGLLLIEFEE